jgi:type 1 glutamine amidotransferase
MKFLQSSTTMIVAAVLLVTVSAFAAGAHKGSFQLIESAQISGKELPAGEYTATWDGEGNNVNVSFVRGGKVIATAKANIVSLEKKSSENAVEVKTSSSGTRALTALRFGGQKYKLDLTGANEASSSGEAVK